MNRYPFNTIFLLFALLCILCNSEKEKSTNRTVEKNKTALTDGQSKRVKPSTKPLDIFQASFNGQLEYVQAAIQNGMLVNSVDEYGRTPLMLAAFNGHTPVVEYLIKHKATINVQDQIGRTALMYASSGDFPATIGLLLNNGAKVNVVDANEGWSALMFAAAEGHISIITMLLDNGADPSLRDIDGDNAWAFAIQRGHREAAELIKKRSTNTL